MHRGAKAAFCCALHRDGSRQQEDDRRLGRRSAPGTGRVNAPAEGKTGSAVCGLHVRYGQSASAGERFCRLRASRPARSKRVCGGVVLPPTASRPVRSKHACGENGHGASRGCSALKKVFSQGGGRSTFGARASGRNGILIVSCCVKTEKQQC